MSKSVKPQTYQVHQVQDTLKNMGVLVAQARKARKWNQAYLGERLGGIDRRHISALEKGDPTVDFGLVASAAWLLDLNLMASMPAKDNLVHVSASINARSRISAKAKKVVSNDF